MSLKKPSDAPASETDRKSADGADGYDYLMHSASANDQTGLIPAGIMSDAERESYQELYPYPPPLLRKEKEQAE
ncbi:MAG: hypothetical protein LIO75_06205 [Lachnospiraceae bacterium]|nr:hypothetical protein [Lachnospiraceae bacterium]